MKNKETKKQMLLSGKYQAIKDYDKQLYKDTGTGLKGTIFYDTFTEDNLHMFEFMDIKDINTVLTQEKADILGISKEELISYFQMNKSRSEQRRRLFRRISFYYDFDCYILFATFTFEDKALKLKPLTRRRKVNQALSSIPGIIDFVGNIDYGKENDREHYHAVLVIKKGEWTPQQTRVLIKGKYQWIVTNLECDYKLGFTTFELVKDFVKDNKKVCNYVAKLTLHALKVNQSKLLMKRDSPYLNSL